MENLRSPVSHAFEEDCRTQQNLELQSKKLEIDSNQALLPLVRILESRAGKNKNKNKNKRWTQKDVRFESHRQVQCSYTILRSWYFSQDGQGPPHKGPQF